MISAPLGDFRHTMHVGWVGGAFGDTSFLNSKADPSIVPKASCGLKHAESIMSFHIDLGPSMLGDVLSIMDKQPGTELCPSRNLLCFLWALCFQPGLSWMPDDSLYSCSNVRAARKKLKTPRGRNDSGDEDNCLSDWFYFIIILFFLLTENNTLYFSITSSVVDVTNVNSAAVNIDGCLHTEFYRSWTNDVPTSNA
ncbi:cdc42 effector protein 4 [Cricetulus griseus]|nr:cdc42 effector protein 4 [Cricetulus griseus]